jgi:hypothetical protein
MLPKDQDHSSPGTPYSIPTLNGRQDGSAETRLLSKEQKQKQFACYIKPQYANELKCNNNMHEKFIYTAIGLKQGDCGRYK